MTGRLHRRHVGLFVIDDFSNERPVSPRRNGAPCYPTSEGRDVSAEIIVFADAKRHLKFDPISDGAERSRRFQALSPHVQRIVVEIGEAGEPHRTGPVRRRAEPAAGRTVDALSTKPRQPLLQAAGLELLAAYERLQKGDVLSANGLLTLAAEHLAPMIEDELRKAYSRRAKAAVKAAETKRCNRERREAAVSESDLKSAPDGRATEERPALERIDRAICLLRRALAPVGPPTSV
jgi:hypothetical protein